jgi:DNA mismatch endonuclease (patch repair protein)
MSRVKGKNTKPEVQVRKYLHAAGFRFTLHGKYKGDNLPGKPDIILPAYKSVVFVHGCFWHAHEGCKFFKIPDTRTEFWKDKLLGNRQRDNENRIKLEQLGWHIFVVWTCDLKTHEKTEIILNELTRQLSLQKQ